MEDGSSTLNVTKMILKVYFMIFCGEQMMVVMVAVGQDSRREAWTVRQTIRGLAHHILKKK